MNRLVLLLAFACAATVAGAQIYTVGESPEHRAAAEASYRRYVAMRWHVDTLYDADSLAYAVVALGQSPESVVAYSDTTASFLLGEPSANVPMGYEPTLTPLWKRIAGWWSAVMLAIGAVAMFFIAWMQVEDTDEYDPDDEEQVIG